MHARAILVGLLVASGCVGVDEPGDEHVSDPGGGKTDDPSEPSDPPGPAPQLPPHNANVDYQLGGAYAPPTGVEIVSRDRHATPAAALYSICYVNGFQIQPNEEALLARRVPRADPARQQRRRR